MLFPLGVGAQRGTERQRSWSPEPGGLGGWGGLGLSKTPSRSSHTGNLPVCSRCVLYIFPGLGGLKDGKAGGSESGDDGREKGQSSCGLGGLRAQAVGASCSPSVNGGQPET